MATANPNHIIAEQNELGEMIERPMTQDEATNYDQITANSVSLETPEEEP
jgi:hypothetical protein